MKEYVNIEKIVAMEITVEEAIAELEKRKEFLTAQCDDCWDPAIELALQALKKQVPMTPDVWGDGYADGLPVYDSWACPYCGWTYELDGEDYEYCPHCGQRIRWTKVKQ